MRFLPVIFLILFVVVAAAIGVQAQPPGAQTSAYEQGVSFYATRKFPEALSQFESSGIPPSQAANAAYYRALCYHQMGRIKQAIVAYKLVVTKFPDTSAAQNSLKVLVKLDPSVANAVAHNPLNQGIDWTGLSDEVSIPYKKGYGGHMFVQAHINGAPVTMLFDTGAGATTSPQSYLSEHGVIVQKTKYGGRMTGVGGEVPAYVALAQVQLGELKRQIPILVEEDEASILNNNASVMKYPLLGQSFFKDIPYEIDDSQHLIIFKKPSAKMSSKTASTFINDKEVPYYQDGQHIIVRPKINGRECEMIFDTGASTVAFADRHLAQCGLNRPTDAGHAHGGGVGGQKEAYVFYLDSVSLGPIERKDVRAQVLINSNFPKPLLGQTFLNGLRYTIDPIKKVIRFE